MKISGASTALEPLVASAVLGGEQVLQTQPRSAAEWIALIRRGIPARAIDSVLEVIDLQQAELSRALDIPERTLIRRKKAGILSPEESEKLLRLARVIERATEVFEDRAAAVDWIKSTNPSLGHATPLSLLDTDLGTGSVIDTLGRIEHGVFA